MDFPFQYFPKYFDTTGIKDKLISQIPLQSDIIIIGRGNNVKIVPEKRKTAWLSDNPKLHFEYSGKVMVPIPIPPFIHTIKSKLYEDFGIEFDGILINYYENGDCGMGYHSDPVEDKWTTDFIILSIGASREFVFRNKKDKDTKITYTLNNGDLIYMFDKCQDDYEHRVKKDKTDMDNRISLVFKKSA